MTPARPPENFVHGIDGPVALVPGRVCRILEVLYGLANLRTQIRGQDAEVDIALQAMHLAGVASASADTGTPVAPKHEPVQRSTREFGTQRAADILGITPRGVLRAIEQGRLRSRRDDGGRHLISEEALAEFAANRRPA